ncbi:DEAD/DEAH box helicase family protein [Curtobacterium sp. VKM Ac-2865]|uniref:DEAD/DEAH box helicase n=1 Tax=Curtobacterium sp. VKM Ac-2865 TaxID=2783817 RepID=UPI00188D9DD4|nr:DEAD/DEAH box helicase family protein [Curtobacterium sp. VKM Ac-2865]MBF4581998.1 DEAD/DEAH box helicase family protein [Curtobacterium sp. VKM Ac-2865]
MKFQLLDFQRVAAETLITEIKKAQSRYDNDPDLRTAIVLEAATGAGKTVIATAVIEQLIFGSDFTEPIENTVILWVTNDPSLNAQTARKMQEASERINDIRVIGQGAAFDEESFEPGVIYFLNTQAASVSARIAKKSDTQAFTIWETIANTVDRIGSRFVVIVDEAHYGVGSRAGGSPTVINKIVNGDTPIPVFIGISATAERLNKALLAQQSRFPRAVKVPIGAVRDSGLVKDRIALAPAAHTGDVIADTTFVRLAVQKTLEYERRWADYAQKQRENPVRPALVVQLPDRKTDDQDFKTLIRTVVDAIVEEWPRLITANIVHTFAEHTPIDLGSKRVVRYMPPQDIQDAVDVRVVLAKTAITTGWDCPRAEVLVSLRASSDYTPIAQLIGRIVRQPLARRIASDETLNRVHAYLPRFDRKTVMTVVGQFSGAEAAGATSEIVRLPLEYSSPDGMTDALAVLARLPSYVVPAQATTPQVRRLHGLANLLDNDGIRPGAFAQATNYLNDRLDTEAAKLEAGGELEKKRTEVSSASIFQILTSIDGSVIDGEQTLVGTRLDSKNVDDVFRRAARQLKDGTAEAYWGYLVDKDPDEDPVEAKITVAALALTPQVVVNIDAAAASLADDWLKAHAKTITMLPEGDRERYERLNAESKEPVQRLSIATEGTIEDAVPITRDADLDDAQLLRKIHDQVENRWPKHLYQDAEGLYWKASSNTDGLERAVLASELSDPQLAAWYRNPTGGDRAVCIPYRDSGTGKWARLYPDFVFFFEVKGEIKASIVDPHGIQLEDWADKLRGYLDYAERHSDAFRAIFPLTEIDGKELILAMHDAKTRVKVQNFLNAGESVEAIFRAYGINY